MAFKEVQDLSADNTISLGGKNKKTGKNNPATIEGYYLGRKEVTDQKKKSGKSFIYIFQTPKGNVGVWGKTDMDRKMEAATPGVMLRITHVGFTATPNGEMYKYKVEFDADNTIDVQTTQASSNDTSSDTEDTVGDHDDAAEGTFQEEDNDQDAELAALEAAAAARKAKVQALLRKPSKGA